MEMLLKHSGACITGIYLAKHEVQSLIHECGARGESAGREKVSHASWSAKLMAVMQAKQSVDLQFAYSGLVLLLEVLEKPWNLILDFKGA